MHLEARTIVFIKAFWYKILKS